MTETAKTVEWDELTPGQQMNVLIRRAERAQAILRERHCECCGRAIDQDAQGRWYAVKGKERGYDPYLCDAVEDERHEPAPFCSPYCNEPCSAACGGTWPHEPGQAARPFHVRNCPNDPPRNGST